MTRRTTLQVDWTDLPYDELIYPNPQHEPGKPQLYYENAIPLRKEVAILIIYAALAANRRDEWCSDGIVYNDLWLLWEYARLFGYDDVEITAINEKWAVKLGKQKYSEVSTPEVNFVGEAAMQTDEDQTIWLKWHPNLRGSLSASDLIDARAMADATAHSILVKGLAEHYISIKAFLGYEVFPTPPHLIMSRDSDRQWMLQLNAYYSLRVTSREPLVIQLVRRGTGPVGYFRNVLEATRGAARHYTYDQVDKALKKLDLEAGYEK